MTETCFLRCVDNFNSRKLDDGEALCVERCSGKLVNVNHRLMGIYASLQEGIMKKRMKEVDDATAKEISLQQQIHSDENNGNGVVSKEVLRPQIETIATQ